MGEVYVAEDTKLDRKIALKVLPPDLAESSDRRARFEREAKTIAALNHPNIVTVHSVEESDGVHFITMELVRGKTLTELLPAKGFPLNKFFEIATPLADAVAAAHDKGITHRDIKPDNIMVSDEGRIKVLDFGLAKPGGGFVPEDDNSDRATALKTSAGSIVGTLHYMSPEQAQGEGVDHRSDIFSLGVVFYEMVSGQRPFEGQNPTSVLSSILKDTPTPVAELNPKIPRDLAKLIQRCLVKDPTRRFQSTLDVRNELEECKQEVDSGTALQDFVGRPASTQSQWPKILGGAALMALVGFFAYSLLSPTDAGARLVRPRQLTSAIGVEQSATWSPDGGRLAYSSNQSGNWDIWVIQIGGGPAVNLTPDYSGNDYGPSWSPDGDRIAFYSSREGGGYFVVSALGGTPRKVADTLALGPPTLPQWSADGTELACVIYEDADGFAEIVSLDSGTSRRVLLPGRDGDGRLDLAWSPDERFLAYVDARNYTAQVTQLFVVRLEDGESIPITDGMTNVWSPIWSGDGRALYFISNRGGSNDLWEQPLDGDGAPRGDPRALTTGLSMRNAMFSPDGARLVYSRGREIRNIFRVPIVFDRVLTWDDAEQLTFDEAQNEHLDLSPDGTTLLVSSDKSGNPDLWLVPLDGGEPQQLTNDPSPDWFPQWSPDGASMAFYSFRSGNREIWVRPVERGVARQLTQGDAESVFPSWSPDGREIAFHSPRSGSDDIYAVSVDGGEPRQVTSGAGYEGFPVYSPDGNWIFLRSRSDGPTFLARVPVEGGEPERLTGELFGFSQFSHDGRHVYFLRVRDGNSNFWTLSLDGGEERAVTDFKGRRGSLVIDALAVDEHYLYFAWADATGDLWLMDVESSQ